MSCHLSDQYRLSFALAALLLAAAPVVMNAQELRWMRLASLPDREGFAYPFAGVSNDALVVAGGANFPGKRPWEGGTKVWYDSAFVLERTDGAWKTGLKLPRPIGYGVSLTTPDGVLCLGGSDASGHFADCFVLRYEAGELKSAPLPRLPKPCANFCGAILEHVVYVAGGIETADATKALHTFWALDLAKIDAGWRELDAWPGEGLMLATAGVQDGSFFLFGGTALTADQDGKPARKWLRDGYRYTPGSGWRRIADLPRPAVAAPTPAPASGRSQLLIIGGDDGKQAATPPTEHKGFPRDVLLYDTLTDSWAARGEVPFSLVTTPAVVWNGHIIVPGGEARPGIRSPEIHRGELTP